MCRDNILNTLCHYDRVNKMAAVTLSMFLR